MKPLILTTAMLFVLTPMQSASLTTTDTSKWYGPGGSGTSSLTRFSPYASVEIQSNESAQYGSVFVNVNTFSGILDPTLVFGPQGYFSHVEASGTAGFTDALTLFPAGGVSTGTLAFNLEMPGFRSPDITTSASGRFTAGSNTVIKGSSSGFFIYYTLTTPFTSGQAIPISAFVQAWAADLQPNDLQYGGGQIGGLIAVRSIQVFDPAGSQLTGYSYTTESDATYPLLGGTLDPSGGGVGNPVTIPEPSYLLLLGMTLIGLRFVGIRNGRSV
jgi:hypothetical protein